MNTLTIGGCCKTGAEKKSIPLGNIHFHVSESDHLRLNRPKSSCRRPMSPNLWSIST